MASHLALRPPQEKPCSAAFPPSSVPVSHVIFQAGAMLVLHGCHAILKPTSCGKNTRCIPPKQPYMSTIKARSKRRSTPKVTPRCCSSSASPISFRSPGTRRFPTASRVFATQSCPPPSARSASSGPAASADSFSQTDNSNRALFGRRGFFMPHRRKQSPRNAKTAPAPSGTVRSAKITHGHSGIHPEIAPAGTQNLIQPVGQVSPAARKQLA